MGHSVDWLRDNIGWVLFTYPDGSQRVVRTTKSPLILGAQLKEKPPKSLYDLDKLRWTPLPDREGVTAQIFEERPILEEMSEFASRFL